MPLNYKNIYTINGKKIDALTLNKEKKTELTQELESNFMQSLGLFPTLESTSSKDLS